MLFTLNVFFLIHQIKLFKNFIQNLAILYIFFIKHHFFLKNQILIIKNLLAYLLLSHIFKSHLFI